VNRARIERLEATVTAAATPENPGAYCRACGGLTIEDAFNAIDTLDRSGTYMTAEAARAVYDALGAGEATCRRCGDVTLYGATSPMLDDEEPA
jgi:hypothetical protein